MKTVFETIGTRYFSLRLRSKLLLPTITVMFIAFLMFTIYIINNQRRKDEAQLKDKAERITALLLFSNVDAIWNYQEETLRLNCESFFNDQELTRLTIVDKYGEELINLSKEITGTHDIVKQAKFMKYDENIATLEVVFTNYYIEQNLAQMRNTILGLSVLVFILMIGLIIVVSQIALQPLKGLMEGVQHLTAGELTFRIPLQSQDELGKLAVSFNTMAHELNLYHDHLQELVEQRTTELTTTNAHLHQEIAERKRAEEALQASEAELRALFAGMTDVVLMLNREGRYLKIAPTSPKLLYRPADELLGKTLHEVFPTPQADIFLAKILQSLETQQTVEIEYLLTIGGTDVWFDGRVSPMSNDTVIFVARDITERKQMEDDLRQAKDFAEAASRAKSVFLANMSHELRTPLNAILGFTQLLAHSSNLAPDQHNNLAIINQSGEHLLTLINQLLDLSKIETGQVTLDAINFDLYHLLDDVIDLFRLRAENQGLQLVFERTPDVPRYIRTDAVKLRQVLMNLLNNAMKFTKEGGVTVRIEQCQLSENSKEQASIVNLQFSISDTGVGMAREEVAQLFQAFVQTQTGQTVQEGTGLGLAISRKFVQLMGGDIQVESEVGHGTTFTFDIQVTHADQSAVVMQPSPISKRVVALAPEQPRYRILIVDDTWDSRQLLVEILNPLGFDLREAENGQEAIEIWKEWHPHLIWMDMRMPVMDGYEATKRIRELATRNLQLATPKIIALTASSYEEERAKVLAAGCDAYLRKPFRESMIFALMHTHIGVQYVYEESEEREAEGDQEKVALTPAGLAGLPAEVLTRLEQAAIQGDTVLVNALIHDIHQHDDAVANGLTALANEFDYGRIAELIQAARQTKS